jgi:RNA polymerase sigma-70 factor (ECF subfamily)
VAFPIAYQVALKMLGSPADAEDVAQETWMAVERALSRSDAELIHQYDAWVRRIAINRAINSYKSKWSRVLRTGSEISDVEPRSAGLGPEEEFQRIEYEERLAQALDELPEPFRGAFLLHYQGHSYEEIAQLQNCPLGTVKARLFRARERLSSVLKQTELSRIEELSTPSEGADE